MHAVSKIMFILFIATASLLAEDVDKPLFDPHGLSLTIGGNGSVSSVESKSIFSSNIGLAQTGNLILPFQVGFRQTVGYENISEERNVLFGTTLFYNATLFTVAETVDFALGFNFGIIYGNTKPVWTTAPEAGIRWWISPRAALLGRIDYPYNLSSGSWFNTLDYFIGFQVNL